jgi:hypothetical protein
LKTNGMRLATRLAVVASLAGGALASAALPANAACATTTSYGIFYYIDVNCASTSYLGKIATDAQYDNLATQLGSSWNNSISSVNESKSTGGESWRLYLSDNINQGSPTLGLSNASTTSAKSWNLTNLNFNDKASSLLQYYSS